MFKNRIKDTNIVSVSLLFISVIVIYRDYRIIADLMETN